MSLTETVKPISYVKSHAAEIVRNLASDHKPIFITQNGEAKAVLMDLSDYEQTQESLAMLRMAAQGAREIREGKFAPMDEAFKKIDRHVADMKKKPK